MNTNKTPVIPTGLDMMEILKKVRTVDSEAPIEIRHNLHHKDKGEYITAFMAGVDAVYTLTKLLVSPAFLSKAVTDRTAAHEDLRQSFTKPGSPYNEIVDNILLAVARYLETHPDVAVKADFTPRENMILANRMTRHMASQHPYATLMRQERRCSL